MSSSSLPVFPSQVTVPKASPGRRQAAGRQEAILQQNHISPPCQVPLFPTSVLHSPWEVEQDLHKIRGKVPAQEAGRMAWARKVTGALLETELLLRAGRVGRRLGAGLWSERCQALCILSPGNELGAAPAVRQGCNVGGRPRKARMRSPIPEACIPDLTLLCHLLAAEGLLFPSLSFCSDIAIPGLQQEPSKGSVASAGFYRLGFRFGQD